MKNWLQSQNTCPEPLNIKAGCSLIPKKIILLLFTVMWSVTTFSQPILIVTTDIGQDPDDQQSLVRLLHYADKFQLAGIVANADANYKHELPVLKDEIIHQLIDAYGEIENNFRVHSPSYPSEAYLHSIVKKGCAGNGRKIPVEQYIGEGKDTEGSNWIIEVVDKVSDTPVNISVWGGACDLAQALWKVKNTRSESGLLAFIKKLRVYFIGKQDSSNQWIIDTFPQLWLVLALAENGNSWESTYRGMFLGGDLSLTSKEWLHENIIGKTPLASLYPDKAYTGKDTQNPHGALKEGDTPSFLFFLENGLNSPGNPAWGGWGGRFVKEKASFFRDAPDSIHDEPPSTQVSSTLASVYRWREDFQRDFATRVQWGATSNYKNANHYPIIQLDEAYFSSRHYEIKAKKGESLSIDASLSFDPDGDPLIFQWFVYPEASGLISTEGINLEEISSSKLTLRLNEKFQGQKVHLILKVTDENQTPLVAYKRFIIRIE